MSFVARSVVKGLAARAAFTNGSWAGAWEAHGSTQGAISPQLRNGTYHLHFLQLILIFY